MTDPIDNESPTSAIDGEKSFNERLIWKPDDIQISSDEPLDSNTTASAEEEEESEEDESEVVSDATGQPRQIRRRKRVVRTDAEELRLLGRRALCPTIPEIAPNMLKLVKLRILGNYLPLREASKKRNSQRS